MATINNKRFTNEEVAVDGNEYYNSTFDNCILVFEGGEAPTFYNCTFRNIKIQLKGAAAQTTNYLQSLYAAGMGDAVEDALTKIEAGVALLPDRPEPPPLVNTGNHNLRLLVLAAPFLIATVWFMGIWYYGRVVQPSNTIADGRPIVSEVNFNLIPVLPDSLADSYDLLGDGQLDVLNSFGIIDAEAGTARIPVDAAIDIFVLQQNADDGETVDADPEDEATEMDDETATEAADAEADAEAESDDETDADEESSDADSEESED